MTSKVHIAFTRSFFAEDGTLAYPGYDLGPLQTDRRLEVSHLKNGGVLRAEELAGVDILVSATGKSAMPAESLPGDGRLVLVARAAAGYEDIDIAACSARDILVVNAADAVRRPTAVGALALILALATRLLAKDAITRGGPEAWPRIADNLSLDLCDQTLGVVGLGNIGSELVKLVRPLGMNLIGHDPAQSEEEIRNLGAEPKGLEDLLAQADIVTLHCPLTPATRHLLDARHLDLMKPSAYLVNAARGGVVDQDALIAALREGRIAGAGLDVFEPEPLPLGHPLLALENVVFGAHALCWTDRLGLDTSRANIAAIRGLLEGGPIGGVVNREVLTSEAWRDKVRALRARIGG